MTAPNVIYAWPWEVNPEMGQWEANPSIVGDGRRHIREDAPELVALVDALRMARDLLEPFADPDLSLGLGDGAMLKIDAAIAAYEALK